MNTMNTISLCRSVEVITSNTVSSYKFSEFPVLVNKFDTFELTGLTSRKKYEKYRAIVEVLGYTAIETHWVDFDTVSKGSANFRITFSRN